MKVKLKKLLPLIGALCVTAFSSAFAQTSYPSETTYGSAMDSSTQSKETTYQRGTFREITPNAGPRVSNGADVFITANFIWWKTVQEGLYYASNGQDLASGSGEMANVGEDWDPGFKIGVGLNLDHDGWDVFAEYTWLRPCDSNSIRPKTTSLTNQILENIQIEEAFAANQAEATWDLDFNVIDFELGRSFYLSQFLTMRPFIGLKGTWQDENTTFTFREAVEDVTLARSYRLKTEVDTWGVGVRAGFNLSYYMTKNWSFFGNIALTNMWVEYNDLDRKDDILPAPSTPNDPTENKLNIKNDSFYATRLITELELGLRWDIWFFDDNYHFAVQAGWEGQVWSDFGMIPVVLEIQGAYDLMLQGLNLKFRFDF